MALSDQLKGLPLFPHQISSSLNGKYAIITSSEEKWLKADGPDYEFSVWFKTPPLDRTTIEKIHSVQLVAESHDQGFCDDPDAGNWTWFEVAIMKKDEKCPRSKNDIELSWMSHVNRFSQSEYDWETGKVFSKDHDMFRVLEEGNVIAVRLCARFAGWEIWARSGALVIELGEQVERKPLNYGQIASNVKTVQEVFQDFNNLVLTDSLQISGIPDALFKAEMINTGDSRPLRVLSLDGGGVRGIAALHLLKAIMDKGAPGRKPCEVFDLIGGTSTGGLIAIMLGRLKMKTEDCIRKYNEFMKVVFPKKSIFAKGRDILWSGAKWDSKPLEKVIKAIIKETLGVDPETVQLMDEESEKSSCKVFVMAVNQLGADNHAPVLLRSYRNGLEKPELPNIKLWEAARATSAAPMYFTPLKVGNYTFVDGGLQANNPLGWLWNEVLAVHGPARPTGCFLSIGTGMPAGNTLSDVRNIPRFASSVAGIATNSEVINILFRSLINAFAPRGMAKKYWRFNVGDGLPDWVEEGGVWKWKLLAERKEDDIGDLDDTEMISVTEEKAAQYLDLPGAKTMVEECATSLL